MKTLLLLLVLLPSISNAQSDTSRFAIGASYSPQYASRLSKSTAETDALSQQLDSLEMGKFSQGFGIHAQYQCNPKFALNVGVAFNQKGYQIDTLTEMSMHSIKYKYNYLEFPIGCNYTITTKNKIQPYIGLNLIFGMLMSHQWTYKQFGSGKINRSEADDDLQKTQLSGALRIGFMAPLNARYTFFVDLFAQQSFNALATGNYERYLNCSGFRLGIQKYIFKH